MKNIPLILPSTAYLVLTTILLSSCTHYYYGPNSANVPLLQNKGDVRVSAGVAKAEETTGIELQSSYAPANHFGVMLNFYTAGGKDETDYSNGSTNSENGRGTYVEAGAGYFNNIDDAGHWIFEAYAGAGTGTITNNYSNFEASKTGVTKFFLQPSIGYHHSNGILQLAIASRFSSVQLQVIEASVSTNNIFSQVELVKNNPNHIFWEPSFIIKMGLSNAKVQLQATPSRAFSAKGINFQELLFSGGVVFTLKSSSKN